MSVCWRMLQGSSYIWGYLVPASILLFLGFYLFTQLSGSVKLTAAIQVNQSTRKKIINRRGLQTRLFLKVRQKKRNILNPWKSFIWTLKNPFRFLLSSPLLMLSGLLLSSPTTSFCCRFMRFYKGCRFVRDSLKLYHHGQLIWALSSSLPQGSGNCHDCDM